MICREVIEYAASMTSSPEDCATMLLQFAAAQKAVIARDAQIAKIQRDAAAAVHELLGQRLCDHEVVKTAADPSGGRDRQYLCLICGHTW